MYHHHLDKSNELVVLDVLLLNLFLKVQKLAERTAEMHIALGSEFEETAFTPTHFNGDYTVWLKNRLTYMFQNRLNMTENNLHKLEGLSLELAQSFLDNKKEREMFQVTLLPKALSPKTLSPSSPHAKI